jgi:hypothetical protein
MITGQADADKSFYLGMAGVVNARPKTTTAGFDQRYIM